MESTQRTLLRLHIEAVWSIHLPPLVQHNVEVLRDSAQPSWKLYVAEMADEQVTVWRPDVTPIEREGHLARAKAALSLPPTESIAGISREIVLHQSAQPAINIETAQKLARRLTPEDHALVDTFEPDSIEYYFHPDRQPLIGVIVEGRLLCLAHSSRRTNEACELGIDTLPEARRRGYALAATILWASLIAQEGRIPFYSAFMDNTASLRLAHAAGYRSFARAASIEG